MRFYVCRSEQLMDSISNEDTLAKAKDCLLRIHCLCIRRHGAMCEVVNVREFLSALMIANKPTHVFEAMGPLEKELLKAATAMMRVFERIMRGCTMMEGFAKRVPAELSKEFLQRLSAYFRSFRAWKAQEFAKQARQVEYVLFQMNHMRVVQLTEARERPDSDLVMMHLTEIDKLIDAVVQKLAHFVGREEAERKAQMSKCASIINRRRSTAAAATVASFHY